MSANGIDPDETPGQRIMRFRNRLPKVDGRRVNGSMLARALGVNRSTVSSWERDEKLPEGQNLVNLAIALGVEPSDILPPISMRGGVTAPMATATGTAKISAPNPAIAHDAKAKIEKAQARSSSGEGTPPRTSKRPPRSGGQKGGSG